jgi:hypothetical protein
LGDDRQGEADGAGRNLSEAEADETLRLLDMRSDPVVVAFRYAPDNDEPWTADDEAAAEADADFAAGRTASLEDVGGKYGIE